MMMKPFIFMALALTFISGGLLFKVKHHVLDIESEMKPLSCKLAETKESLSVLKTEWAYLTNPQRIHKLTQRYLSDLRPIRKEQMLAPSSSRRVFTQRMTKIR